MDIVIPADGVSAVEVAMSYWVPQLDICGVGHDRFVVRLEFWTISARHEQPGRAEELEEYPFELSAEDHVDDEVDAAVDGHQQIADLHHPLRRIRDERLVYVRDHGQNVADQEHDHHAHQHRRQADLATLMTRQLLQVSVRFSDLETDIRLDILWDTNQYFFVRNRNLLSLFVLFILSFYKMWHKLTLINFSLIE